MLLKLYGKEHEAIDYLVNCKDIKIENSLNMGEKKISFTYPYTARLKIKNEFYIRSETDEFVVKETSKGKNGYYNIAAELNLEDIKGRAHAEYTTVDGGNTAQECADAALRDTGWTCVSTIGNKKRGIVLSNVNSYEVFQKICEAFNCEIQFDTLSKTAYLLSQVGTDKGTYFMSGFNMKDVSICYDSYDYFTRILPMGAEGLTISAVNGGIPFLTNNQYSNKIKTLIWEDSNYKDANALKEDAEYKLNELSQPKKSISIKIIDLSKTKPGYDILSYSIGDSVMIADSETETKEKQRIVKIVEYPEDPTKNSCELSNTVLSFEEMQKKLFAAANSVENVTNGNIVIGGKVEGLKANQIEGLEIYYTEALSNTEIEDICK